MHCLYLCQFFIQLSDFCTILEPELCTILGFLVNVCNSLSSKRIYLSVYGAIQALVNVFVCYLHVAA